MKKMLKSALSLLLVAMMVMSCMVVAFAADETSAKADAYADLSSKDSKSSGMLVSMANNANVTLDTRDGRTGWSLFTNQDNNGGDYLTEKYATINVDLDNSVGYDVSDGSTYVVEVDYYDEKGGVFSLIYDGQSQFDRYHSSQLTTKGAKGEPKTLEPAWRTASFRIQDAKFANRLDNADIKVSVNYMTNNHPYKADTPTPFGTKYALFYPRRYGRISTYNPVLIGGIRVYKLETVNPFTVTITTDEHGNNFFDDEPIKFNVTLKNNTDKAYDLNVNHKAVQFHEDYVAYDYQGDPVSIGAKEEKTFTVIEPNSPFGLFDYSLTFTADGVESIVETEYSRIREAKIQNLRAATNIHLEGSDTYPNNYEATFEMGRKAGYFSFRDSMRWPSFEVSPGHYEMRDTFVPAMQMAKEWGMDWMATYQSTPPNFIVEDTVAANRTPMRTEKELTAFANMTKWLVQQITDAGGTSMESHNEWNLAYPTGTGEDYALYMKTFYEAAKSVNPDMKIIGIDIALFDSALIRRMFDAGSLEYMDGISFHPYDWTRPVEIGSQFANASSARELMAEYGGEDKELWLTETGWHESLNHEQNAGMTVTEHDKGYYIARALLQNDAGKFYDRIYFYEFVNSGIEWSYGEARYGTLQSNYDAVPYGARPAYITTATANWMLGGAEFKDTIDGPKVDLRAGTYVYRWTRPDNDGWGNQFIGLWTTKVRENVSLDLGVDEAILVDMYGNAKPMKAVNGVFNFMLSEEPQYVVGNFTKFKKAEATVKSSELIAVATIDDTVIVNLDAPGVASGTIVPVNGHFEVIENTGIVNGAGKYVVKTPNLPFFNKTIRFDVLDAAGNVLYNANIHVNNEKTISLKETHELSDPSNLNRWKMQIDITNNKNSAAVNGMLNLEAPSEITKYIQHIKIADLGPKQTLTYKMFMPELITKEMRDYKSTVTLDNGETFVDEHKLFFTSVPYATTVPTIDGVASRGEYNDDAWFPIKGGEGGKNVELLYGLGVWLGDDDLSGTSTMLWDEDNIYFFIEITDNVFVNNQSAGLNIWNGDSIQIGLADAGTTGSGGYAELTVALSKDGPCMYRHLANNADKPTGIVENVEMAIVRDGVKTRYELAIPWEECLNKGIDEVGPGYQPRFAFLVNEDDGLGRNSYIEYSQQLGAIGTAKNAGWFSDMILADK